MVWLDPPEDPPSRLERLKALLTPKDLPSAILPSLALTSASLLTIYIYTSRLRRYPTALHLPPSLYHSKRHLHGFVPRVGDGDNFRLFHTPGGRLLGWGWLRAVPDVVDDNHRFTPKGQGISGSTISVRIAGVDAPEYGHFGKPAQFHGEESLRWLQRVLLGKWVRVRVYRRDQYDRVVGSVGVRTWWGGWRDLGGWMVEEGIGCVYEGSYGAEFGGREARYRELEVEARRKKVGMWAPRGRGVAKEVSPATYKKMIRAEEDKKREEEQAVKRAERAAQARTRAKAAEREVVSSKGWWRSWRSGS